MGPFTIKHMGALFMFILWACALIIPLSVHGRGEDAVPAATDNSTSGAQASTPSTLTSTGGNQSCDDGQYIDYNDMNKCKNCNAGQFSSNGESCELCPAGRYQDRNASKLCYVCLTGKFTDKAGQTSCKECEIGTGSEIFETSCKTCPPGKYNRWLPNADGVTTNTGCWNCPSGKYQDESGALTCKHCEQGKRNSVSGAVKCCDPGSVYDGSTCVACNPGRYFYEFDATCVNCPSGKYQDESGALTCKNNSGSSI